MFGWLETALEIIRVDDASIDTIRQRVQARICDLTIKGRSRRAARAEIESAAKDEIIAAFRDAHPLRKFKPTRTWPDAHVMIDDEGDAMVDIWIGHDYGDDDGIEPIRITTNWRARRKEK